MSNPKTYLEVDDAAREEKQEVIDIQDKMYSIKPAQLEQIIDKKKKEISNEIVEYMEKNDIKRISYSKLYEIMSSGNKYNRRRYSPQELFIVFETFKSITSDITLKDPKHTPTKQNFCAFAGISTSTYNTYKDNVDDPDLTEVIQRIEDYIIDVNLSMGARGLINYTTAIYRTKTEHGYVEPKEFIAISQEVNFDRNDISERLNSVRGKTNIENK